MYHKVKVQCLLVQPFIQLSTLLKIVSALPVISQKYPLLLVPAAGHGEAEVADADFGDHIAAQNGVYYSPLR